MPPRVSVGGFVVSGGNVKATMGLGSLTILTKRADFLKAARAKRISTPGFTLQYRARDEDEASGIRIGFTCSKKVGNAVARNRAKRRLREIARMILPEHGHDGFDYVLIGRRDSTATQDFAEMRTDLERALKKAHPKATE
jgi:ribonuclease P protein component